jgi:hypothetical protein
MLVTVTLQAVYVLVVAAPPLPVKYCPSCPGCRGPLICLGYVPASDWPFAGYDSS